MPEKHCSACGGGGRSWYPCICDGSASIESVNAVNATLERHQAYARAKSKMGLISDRLEQSDERFGKYLYDYLSPEEFKALNFDASIIVVCASEDAGNCGFLSRWLYQRGFVSVPDGFCEMPLDADNHFHVRAVTVRNLRDDGVEQLEDKFRALDWRCPYSAHMLVRMNGADYRFTL